MRIYGRENEIEEISASTASFVVVAGDSGIGKSAILTAASERLQSGVIRTAVADLQRAPGALHRALIRQLAAVLDAHLAQRTGVEEAADFIKKISKRIAAVGGKEIARAVGTELLGVLKTQLGGDFGESIGRISREIFEAGDEALQQRLQNSTDLGTVEIVLSFALEVSEFTESEIVIFLDRAERLSESDKRILADVAGLLPPRVRIVAGWSTSENDDELRSQLSLNGAHTIVIPPLDTRGVSAWLDDVGLVRSSPEIFLRVTSGYPLFVAQAIAAVQLGEPIANIDGNGAFGELMKMSWRRLSIHAKAAARKLAIFTECPPDDFIRAVLGIDQHAWSTLREELLQHQIFVRSHDNISWFHDRRRDLLWRTVMNDVDRETSTSESLHALDPWLRNLDHIPWWSAACMPEVLKLDELPAEHSSLGSVQNLTRGSLSVLFALIELLEPTDDGTPAFIETASLLSYAASVPGVEGDAVDALEKLVEQGFAFTSTNDRSSLTTIRVPTNGLVYAAILGRMTQDFGRWVIPRAASMIFERHVRPNLGAFLVASYGIGPSSVTTSAEKTVNSLYSTGSTFIGRKPSVLALQGTLGDRSFHAGIGFYDNEQRDAVHQHLRREETRIGGERLLLSSLHSFPSRPVRSSRFRSTLDVLDTDSHSWSSDFRTREIQIAEARVRFAHIVRDRMDETERVASGLELPYSILLDLNGPPSVLEIRLSGGRGPRVDVGDLIKGDSHPVSDPLFMFKLQRDGIILPGERVQKRILRSSRTPMVQQKRPEPLSEVWEDISKEMAGFNRLQNQEVIDLEPVELERRISEFQAVCRADAFAFESAGFALKADAMASLALSIWISPADSPWGGFGASSIARDSDESSVEVHISGLDDPPDDFRKIRGLQFDQWDPSVRYLQEHASAEEMIGGLLGYGNRELRFA